MKPAGHGEGRGLNGLARIKVSVSAAADRAMHICRPSSMANDPRSPRTGWRAAFSKVSTVLGLVLAVSIACLLVMPLWRHMSVNPMDMRQLARPVRDGTLRSIGEKSAAAYPGLRDMGLAPASKRAYMPLDGDAARQSCVGTGHTQGAPMMTVLVTGAGGFIGMHAALMLRQRGHGVLGFDNFNDYYPVALKRARQAKALSEEVYIVDGDLNDGLLLRRLFGLCEFSHVLHLAAQAGVRYATKNPYSYVHANVAGHVTLLEAIKEQDPMPRLVYASSSSVYGLNQKQPFSEGDRVDNPASLYASTKRADELICHTYFNIYGMSVTGLRFFTVYGPWGRPDMAAFKFAKNIMMGKPITIYQGPNKSELRRDFTYIDDIVDGIMGTLAKITPSGKASAEYKVFNLSDMQPNMVTEMVFNLGNTQPHTVTEMVDLLETHLGRKAVREYIPVPPTGDVLATFADITAARKELGYKPQTPLDEGIQRFCEWFKRYYELRGESSSGKFAPDWAYNPLR